MEIGNEDEEVPSKQMKFARSRLVRPEHKLAHKFVSPVLEIFSSVLTEC